MSPPLASPTQSTISLLNLQSRSAIRSMSTGSSSVRYERSLLRPSYQLNGLFPQPSLRSLNQQPFETVTAAELVTSLARVVSVRQMLVEYSNALSRIRLLTGKRRGASISWPRMALQGAQPDSGRRENADHSDSGRRWHRKERDIATACPSFAFLLEESNHEGVR